MNHHVGITAYGRCEVGVIVEPKAVVADVFGCIDGLCHGPDGKHGDEVLLPFALHVLKHLVDGAVDLGGRTLGLQAVAESAGNGRKIGQLGCVGLVVNAIHERLPLAAALRLSDCGRHGAVGKEHELLYELVGILRHLEIHAYGVARLVDIKAHFLTVEINRTVLKAARTQLFGQTVECQQFLSEVSLARLDHLLGLFIGKAAVALYDGAAYAAVEHV